MDCPQQSFVSRTHPVSVGAVSLFTVEKAGHPLTWRSWHTRLRPRRLERHRCRRDARCDDGERRSETVCALARRKRDSALLASYATTLADPEGCRRGADMEARRRSVEPCDARRRLRNDRRAVGRQSYGVAGGDDAETLGARGAGGRGGLCGRTSAWSQWLRSAAGRSIRWTERRFCIALLRTVRYGAGCASAIALDDPRDRRSACARVGGCRPERFPARSRRDHHARHRSGACRVDDRRRAPDSCARCRRYLDRRRVLCTRLAWSGRSIWT